MKTLNVFVLSLALLVSCKGTFANDIGASVNVSVSAGEDSAPVTKKECKSMIQMEESALDLLYGSRLSKEASKKFAASAKSLCDEAVSTGLSSEETVQRLTSLLNTVSIPGDSN